MWVTTMAYTDEVTVSKHLQDGCRFLADVQQRGMPTLVVEEPQSLGAGDRAHRGLGWWSASRQPRPPGPVSASA
jgi:hypothetical protein